MTSLTAIFGNSRDGAGDSEKLLELYWNRAELKKEFANLRDESFRLKDQVKEQKGLAARAEQKLEQLENLLLDPDWVYTTVTFYQFKALDAHLTNKVARFAEQLKQQREKRQHKKLLQTWQGKRQLEARRTKAEIQQVRALGQDLNRQLDEERERFSAMGRVRRFFLRRSSTRRLDEIADELESLRVREEMLRDSLAKISQGDAPDAQGLDIQSKRSINLMILSFAQQVYQHFSVDNVAALAKESGGRSIGSIKYGGKRDCDQLLMSVTKLHKSMPKASELAAVLQTRARLLAVNARFQSEDDSVPTAESLSTLFEIDEDGKVTEATANLLGENYWGLSMTLSR